jgi:hypothetical protein
VKFPSVPAFGLSIYLQPYFFFSPRVNDNALLASLNLRLHV